MSGWFAVVGQQDQLDEQIDVFRQRFSVPNVPNLSVEERFRSADCRIVSWSWGPSTGDVSVVSDEEYVAILFGVFTDLGKFGQAAPNGTENLTSILSAWRLQGDRVLAELNGSFSLVFVERKSGIVHASVDRFASRHIWYSADSDRLILGNFPTAVATMKHDCVYDPAGLWSLLHAGRPVHDKSLYRGIKSLLAGESLEYKNRTLLTKLWYQIKYAPRDRTSVRGWGEQVSHAISESGRGYRKIGGQPILFLSGGLDSRLALAGLGEDVESINLTSSVNAESKIAAQVAKAHGARHTHIVRSRSWLLDSMDSSALISSGCYTLEHAHFIRPVIDRLRGNDGDTAEFFLGDLLENLNKNYFQSKNDDPFRCEPESIEEFIFTHTPKSYLFADSGQMGTYLIPEVRDAAHASYQDGLRESCNRVVAMSEDEADRFDSFLRWSSVGVFPTYNMLTCIWPLARERNLMFDNHLHDLVLSIPASIKARGGVHAHALKCLSAELSRIADANTFLPPGSPYLLRLLAKTVRPQLGKIRRRLFAQSKKLNQRTSGSWPVYHQLYRNDPAYRERLEYLFFGQGTPTSAAFDIKKIRRDWKEFIDGNISLLPNFRGLLAFKSVDSLIPGSRIATD